MVALPAALDEELLPWPRPVLRVLEAVPEADELGAAPMPWPRFDTLPVDHPAVFEDWTQRDDRTFDDGTFDDGTLHDWALPEPLVAPSATRGRSAVHLDVADARLDEADGRRLPASRGVRRRRAVLGTLVVATLIALALPIGAIGGHSVSPSGVGAGPLRAGHTYVVRPGDTLWGIATRLHPAGDPRTVVDRLEAEVGSDTVVPGEHLRLP
jgi:nucleoid-associated protein YgaU